MENGQQQTKTEDTNNVTELVADEVKNATPIAGDTNDVKDENVKEDANKGDSIKEENDTKEKSNATEEKSNATEEKAKEEEPSAELLEKIKEQIEVWSFVLHRYFPLFQKFDD